MQNTSSDIVRIGAIGVGGRLLHILDLLSRGNARLKIVALADPSQDSIQRAREKLSLSEDAVRSEEEVYQDPDIDWIMIGSPNRFHARQVIRALDAGKHVFCEKPLAISLDDVPPMVEAWRRSGKTFALGLVLRYAQIYKKMREILDSGMIGNIVSLEFNETLKPGHGGYIHGNWRRHRANAGTHLLEKCCHDLDLCLWLLGSRPVRAASFGGCNFFRPENSESSARLIDPGSGLPIYQTWRNPAGVDPFTGDKDIVDNQVAIVEFENGARATFHTNCNTTLPERRFYIVGTLGTLRGDALTGRIEAQATDPSIEPISLEVGGRGGHAGGDEIMAEGLSRTMLTGESPEAGMREGLESLVMATGIDQALDEGKIVDYRDLWDSVRLLDI